MKFSHHIKLASALSLAITGIASAVPQELLEGLADENYQLREKAEQDIAEWAKKKGQGSFDELNELKKNSQSPEVKSRLDNVMSGVTVYKSIPGTRGFMGISMLPEIGASVINRVTPGTPAEKAGLMANDKIIELDGIKLSKKDAHLNEATDFLRGYVKSKKSGEKLSVKIERGGKILTKDLKLGSYDEFMKGVDPFGNGFNGGIQILPQGGGFQGRIEIVPGGNQLKLKNLNPRQLKENEKQRLELNLMHQQRLLGKAELPNELKELLEKQNDRNKKRIEQLKQELLLEEKKKK